MFPWFIPLALPYLQLFLSLFLPPSFLIPPFLLLPLSLFNPPSPSLSFVHPPSLLSFPSSRSLPSPFTLLPLYLSSSFLHPSSLFLPSSFSSIMILNPPPPSSLPPRLPLYPSQLLPPSFFSLSTSLSPLPLPFPSPGGRVHRAARDSLEPPGGDRRLLDPSGNHHLRDPRPPPRLRAQAGRSAQALQRGREFPFPLAFSCVLFGRSWMQLHLDLFVCVSMYVYIYIHTYTHIYVHRIILEHAYIHIHKTETLSIVVF